MSGRGDLVPAAAQELLALIPQQASADQARRFDDLRIQTRLYAATLLATVPAGPRRDDALLFLRRVVGAAVLGILTGAR